jgi:RNA polymerase sigma-70 factor (ECF subfamily)
LPFTPAVFSGFSNHSGRTEIMKVHIKIYGQSVNVEVSVEVGEYLDRADHKTENLFHEHRRHWDEREFDEYIVAHECSWSYYETPEDWLCRKEIIQEITAGVGKLHENSAAKILSLRIG